MGKNNGTPNHYTNGNFNDIAFKSIDFHMEIPFADITTSNLLDFGVYPFIIPPPPKCTAGTMQ